MTTFTSEDREMAAKHDGIESPHNACCYKNKCLQQQFELTQWKALSNFESKTLEDCNTVITNQQAEIEALKKEIASWMEQIDIEKLIIRDLEKDFYKLEIKKLAAEVVSYRTDAEKLTMRLIDLSVLPPIKKLTDEEKWKLWGECPNGLVYDRVMMFADLVLRKAHEK